VTYTTERIVGVALARYGREVMNVDAESITLSDGTKIFFQSLYLELGEADPQLWSAIAEEWFTVLDVARERIARSG
jgi:hypothetical protein